VAHGARAYFCAGRRPYLWEAIMQYIQTMMRKEPVTFIVFLLLIAILAFGAWDFLHVVKR
jgi:hypothetical protein